MAEITSAKAMARTVRVSPRKSRLVLDNIRGKSVADAIAILTFTPNKAAEIIQSNRETHKLIAEALLKYETLDSTQIKSLYETGKMPETVEEESHALSYDEVKSKMSEEK